MAGEKTPLKWKFETGGEVRSIPEVSDGVVYFCSDDGALYALDTKTGKEKWKFETGAGVCSSPAVSDGAVYFGSYDHYLYAVDIKTGKEKWKFKTGDAVYSSPAVVDGVVYVGSGDHHLYAVDIKTGAEKWKFKTGFWVYSSPAVADGVAYFGSGDNHLYAVDIEAASALGKEENKRQEEADKHGITAGDIRTKYISGDITLEEAIELQKEEEQKRKEAGYKVTLETSSRCTIIEIAAGTVDISEIVNAISSGESIEDKWYDYNDIRHVYGTTDIADTVNFSNNDIQDKWDEDGYLDISDDADADDFDIDSLEKGNYKYLLDSPTFILTAESYEKGKWNTYSIDIKGKFDPELIKPSYEGGLICGYEYEGTQMHSNQDMQSETSNTDVSLYLVTKDGIELADFDEIRDNMTEKSLDSENVDDIRKYLKDEYGVE